jgi:hydroxymethylglutaryl-CoA lyase
MHRAMITVVIAVNPLHARTKVTMFDVLISEVGPRDGLQSVKRTMSTPDKQRWIDALVAAGIQEIEVGSFVSPKLLPQMADTAQIVRHALQYPGLTVMALVPNARGAQMAIDAGVHKVTLPVSASEAHSMANVRKTRQEMLEEINDNESHSLGDLIKDQLK